MIKFVLIMILIRAKENLFLIVLLSTLIIGGLAAFPISYISLNTVIGFCLLPFVLLINGPRRLNLFCFFIAISFGIVSYIFHVRTFYFLSLAFYTIVALELLLGRVNSLTFFLIIVMSPVFIQASVVIGFPIRLFLSTWAGGILNWAGFGIQVEGNTLMVDGFDFTVDEACMGLSMLSISLMMGVFILAHQYRTTKSILSFKYLTLFFVIVFLLNILCNLLRIILLVAFKILPGNPWHEIVGILCLIFYVVVPLYYLSRIMVARFGRSDTNSGSARFSLTYPLKIGAIVLSFLLMIVGFTITPGKATTTIPYADVKFGGMIPVNMDGGVTKILSDDLLIYVKPIPEFFTSEHTPLLCWKGSGYSFKNVDKVFIGEHEIYQGILTKGGDILYTAWWYTNGDFQTVDQFKWRSMMFMDKQRFYLVNVTAKDKLNLETKVIGMLTNRTLTIKEL